MDNAIDGDVSAALLARDINADQIVVAGGPNHPGPAMVSIAVPTGRLHHEIRGRTAVLSELSELITGENAAIVVLCGAGGYGKTTIALSLAASLAPTREVWWVDATTGTAVADGLREVALEAGASAEAVHSAWTGQSSAPDLLWRTLNSWTDPWLLVLDNADDTDMLSNADGTLVDSGGWIRTPTSAGTVVLTTRDGRPNVWGNRARLVPVDALNDADSAAVLLDWAPYAGDATRLAKRLSGLPLALRLAGSHLASTSGAPRIPGWEVARTFDQYLAAWESRRVDIVDSIDHPISDERRMLSRTWELSLDLLASRGLTFARPLMRLLSFLAPAPIPYRVLDANVLADSPLFDTITPPELARTLVDLIGVGLIEPIEGDSESFVLHPVVRDTNQRQANADAIVGYHRLCVSLLYTAMREVTYQDPGSWPLGRALLPHCVLACADDGIDDGQARLIADLAFDTGYVCRAIGPLSECEILFRRALEIQEHTIGAEHPDTLSTRHYLAATRRDLGDVEWAERAYREILALRTRILGTAHTDTLHTRHMLANIRRFNNELDLAENDYHDIIHHRETALGHEHRDTLRTRRDLAILKIFNGDLNFAESEYRDMLAIQQRNLGGTHLETLLTRYSIAKILLWRDNLMAAEAEYRDIIAVERAMLGEEHPATLHTRHSLALLLERRRELVAAEREYREVLAIRERVVGSFHPATINIRSDLDRVIWVRDRPSKT